MKNKNVKILQLGDEEAFHDFRNSGIGGSDIAVILGKSPYKKIEELWEEKKGLNSPFISKAMLKRFEEGKYYEKYIIDYCIEEKNLNYPLRSLSFYCIDHPELRGNLDAVGMNKYNKIVGIEAKTALLKNKKNWINGIPEYYKLQCFWYAYFLNIEIFYVPVFFLENGEVKEKNIFEFNINEVDNQHEIIEKALDFWDHVINKDHPPSNHQNEIISDNIEKLYIEYNKLKEKEEKIVNRKKEIINEFKNLYKIKKGSKGINLMNKKGEKIGMVFSQNRKYFNKEECFKLHPYIKDIYNAFNDEKTITIIKI
jgi:putative phage-type endonuclease